MSSQSRDLNRQSLGAEGEARAAAYLERRGYRIVARNVRPDGVEVDLIARRGRLLVFVEVKTRRSTRYGAPEAAVDAPKQARLVRAARAWLHMQPGWARSARIRFDVIAWRVESGDHWRVTHVVSAFDAQG